MSMPQLPEQRILLLHSHPYSAKVVESDAARNNHAVQVNNPQL
jgi:hypothetical protein